MTDSPSATPRATPVLVAEDAPKAARIALSLARVPASQLDGELERALRLLGTEHHIEALSICEVDDANLRARLSWNAGGWDERLLELLLTRAQWLREVIENEGEIILDSVEELPEDADLERATFKERDSCSVAAFPLRCELGVPGYLIAERRGRPMRWTPETLAMLAAAAESMAVALDRQSHEHRLRVEIEEARRSRANQASFLAEFAHELRAPLTAIIGYSELLEAELAGPLTSEQKGYLSDVLDSATHLSSVISDTLELARMESGELELCTRELDLDDLLRQSMAQIVPRARKAGVDTLVEASEGARRIKADPSKLRQVLINLLVNAVKFTPSGGSITVSAEVRDDDYDIEVSDTGVGISPRDQRRIFQRFARVWDRQGLNAASGEGSGLGLSLVERLVALHGGQVSVASVPGAGSTFRVTLPRWPSSQRTRRPYLGGLYGIED